MTTTETRTATVYSYETGHEITAGLFPDATNPGEALAVARRIATERGEPVTLDDPDEGERTVYPDAEATAEGYRAELRGDCVEIYDAQGVWAGTGRWAGSIQDCDAVLGSVPWDGSDAQQRESERIYDALDAALSAALDSDEG